LFGYLDGGDENVTLAVAGDEEVVKTSETELANANGIRLGKAAVDVVVEALVQ